MPRESVFETILKLGVLGALLLTVPGTLTSFRPSYSQSYLLQTSPSTSTPVSWPPASPTHTSTPGFSTSTPALGPTSTPSPTPSALPAPMPTTIPRSYPPMPTQSLPAQTETPRPYPSRPTPASFHPLAETPWPAVQLGSIVIAALAIAGVAASVRFYRRRRQV